MLSYFFGSKIKLFLPKYNEDQKKKVVITN